MADVKVSSTTRTLTLELTPAEAQAIAGNFNQSREPSYPGKLLYGALMAIAGQKNYGGSD